MHGAASRRLPAIRRAAGLPVGADYPTMFNTFADYPTMLPDDVQYFCGPPDDVQYLCGLPDEVQYLCHLRSCWCRPGVPMHGAAARRLHSFRNSASGRAASWRGLPDEVHTFADHPRMFNTFADYPTKFNNFAIFAVAGAGLECRCMVRLLGGCTVSAIRRAAGLPVGADYPTMFNTLVIFAVAVAGPPPVPMSLRLRHIRAHACVVAGRVEFRMRCMCKAPRFRTVAGRSECCDGETPIGGVPKHILAVIAAGRQASCSGFAAC
jgi:hypothetical protein